MFYEFTYLKKGESKPSTERVQADSVWEANKKFRALNWQNIIKKIRHLKGVTKLHE
jgi:hypothetical protein